MASYAFVQRDADSSVYTALAHALQERPEWRRLRRDSDRFHLMLGDRAKLPWGGLHAMACEWN